MRRTGQQRLNNKLRGANLTDAILTSPNPDLADATSAYLDVKDLTSANFTRTRWPPAVTVPEGWERDLNSGLLGRASGELSDAR
jgi:uncharacterized protein YjbI with pentapeptide repeats